MYVTVFKNFNEVVEHLSMPAILELIRDGKYRPQVEALRNLITVGNKKEYDQQKKSLPAFTPSGSFEGGRKMEFLKEYSGYIILDIDKLSQDALNIAFNKIIEIPYTAACFRSPSNNGLKIIVISDATPETHKNAFNDLKEYYETILHLEIDKSGKDITRLCFFSYDQYLYYNPDSTVFDVRSLSAVETLPTVTSSECETPTPVILRESGVSKNAQNPILHDIESITTQIEKSKIDITGTYDQWLEIGFALADALGADGRNYFHRISQFNQDYTIENCNDQYSKCLNSNGQGITIKSLFFFAKEQGIDISPVNSTTLEDDLNIPESDTKKKKDKKKNKTNQMDIIEKHLLHNYIIRYNVVSGILEVKQTAQPNFEPMTDYLENSIYRQLHKNNICVSMAKLRSILQSDFCPRFDPFKEYFDNLPPWDQSTDHIQQLAQTINTTDDVLWQQCLKKWIVAVAASVLDAKVINHTAIIFSGAQGIGKTTWMEKLCPVVLRPYLFSGTINPNNKDTLIHLTECMLINMDELENMNRTEIGTLKEIITKSAIRIRRSYGHNNECLIRRASFMGSVNTSQFLNDSTGSRRFLCFEALNIQYQHSVDINMVYAQALSLWKSGFRFYFDKSEVELISSNNEKYQIKTTEEELLLTWFRPIELSECNCFLTATQIMYKLSINGKINVSNGSVISLGKALRKHGFIKTKKGSVYVWAVQELTQDQVDDNSRAKPETPPF